MGAPYRDAVDAVSEVDIGAEPTPLAAFDVSGRDGAAGEHGMPGGPGIASGSNGQSGGHAGVASPGQGAGDIRLALVADGEAERSVRIEGVVGTREVHDLVMIDEDGWIGLRAVGGDGGKGGNGGDGGDGARGANGSDATRWSNGSDGGDGGDGGCGGNATSGAAGGPGGRIDITVSEDDTPLLMLVRHDVRGGKGGARGRNGSGGSGGSGGRGGDSYSWTETENYTDSNGNSQTRTHWHRNSGGSNGSSGATGPNGSAKVRDGEAGANGTFTIHVGDQAYDARYDLRLVAFAHDSQNEDAVYEPNELVRVFDLEVENAGGMPTPTKDVLFLALEAGGWVRPEPGELTCIAGLAAGERYKVPGELAFRIKDYTPDAPGEPLEVEETILQRAMLPSVRRAFADYQPADDAQGRFVIRFPLRCSAVSNLRSLAAGEATKVRFAITNQSRFALGAASDSKRVVRVRVATAADSELGDDSVAFEVDGRTLAPGTGWTTEIPNLGAGDTADLELVVRFAPTAAEYQRFAAHVTLELGALDAPASPRPIQLRDFDVRVARPFAVSDADLLLVVNHRTTREVIDAWTAATEALACKVAIWDLTREGHLDLERPLADGIPLGEWFAHKAVVLLDNAIDGPDGPTHPHVYLDEAQAARAAADGLDVAIVGKGLALPRLLVPEGEPVTLPVYRSFWLRWWAKPTKDWLAKRALALSTKLATERPDQRHLVVHRFAPAIEGKSAWMNRWKVGTLDAYQTLDTAAGAVVHADGADAQLADPAFVTSDHVRTALLVMFGFEENLARLAVLLRTGGDHAPVVDALVLDLANELLAAITPGWMGETDAPTLPLPRFDALERGAFAIDYETGAPLRRMAARLLFLARSQVGWWENIPPFRWMRRSPASRARIVERIERWLGTTFGIDAKQALEDTEALVDEMTRDHKAQRKSALIAKRRAWAVEQARLPIASTAITSDTELLATHQARVMSADEYDALCAAKATDRARRELLLVTAAKQHAELFVR